MVRRGGLALLLGALAFLSAACSSTTQNLRLSARDDFIQADFSGTEKDLYKPEIVGDEKGRILTLLDLGLAAHYAGQYEKSNVFLFKAKQAARELYTQSILEDAASLLFSDNAKSYPGMEYELSLLHYYTTLNFLFLAQSEKISAWEILEMKDGNTVRFPGEKHEERELSNRDRAKFREQARSELLAWNAFLEEVRQRNRGEPYYKDDLLNNVFAAYVHESMDTTQDRNIAKVLLQNADRLLIRAYCAYPSFNKKWEAYVNDYSRFESLGEAAVSQNYVDPTALYSVTKKEITEDGKRGNIYFLVESQEVPLKQEKKYVIGLSTVMSGIKDPYLRQQIEQIGVRVFLEMAPKFGLAFFGAAMVGGAAGDNPKYISEAVDSAVGFEFKLPVMETPPFEEAATLRFTSEKGEERIFPLALLSPVADIAKLNVNRRADALALKTGLRVGAKYMAALVPAILTYRRMQNSPEFLRLAAATGVWIAGKKAVDAMEKADLREWDLLPLAISGAKLALAPGKYKVALEESPSGKKFDLGEVNVTSEPHTYRARVFSSGKVVLN